jgi:hypothetical protein
LIPIRDERFQVLSLEVDTEKVLKGIGRTMFHIRAEMIMQHEKNLATPDYPSLIGFSLFRAKSPVMMLVRADRSLASNVANGATFRRASIV